MSASSEITFAGYPILSCKNWYYPEVVNSIFQPSDFVFEKRKYKNPTEKTTEDTIEVDTDEYDFKGFIQTVKVCKQRLEIYGITYKTAKKDFLRTKRENKDNFDVPLSGFSYDDYLLEIKNIIEQKTGNINFFYIKEDLVENDFVIYGQCIKCHLYSVLSVLDEDDIVEYDLTDIIWAGWVTEDYVKSINVEKVIVLTEGKTDVEFISKSIQKLFPHLKDYYHFIDFEEYKVETSASALVKLIMSFAAAKVKHPVIALFDNDTAGLKEMKNLTLKILPSNIKILKYPDILLAKKYPTLGPNGKKNMNINGRACSIEMYFGIDVLTKDKELIPIRWKGFDSKEKKYQGEISDKNYVQETFRKKLKMTSITEIKELTELLNMIFNAFG
jgi:5S rRNA maturation endonuclease (ribonuclease M5)